MGCIAEVDTPLRTIHIDLTNIDKVVVISVTTCTGRTDGFACIRVRQDDMSIGCHLPYKRCIVGTTVNLERLVEFVVKHSQRHIARVVGFGLYGNQGTIEGFAVLGHVFILESLVPQANKALLQPLLTGGRGNITIAARCQYDAAEY